MDLQAHKMSSNLKEIQIVTTFIILRALPSHFDEFAWSAFPCSSPGRGGELGEDGKNTNFLW